MTKSHVVFLPIGDKSCGDAIAIRFGDLESGNPADQSVILIDGGYTDDWSKAVGLVKNTFGLPRVNLMVSSHLDGDHIGGMLGIIEHMPVDKLWMHLPWQYSDEVSSYRQSSFTASRRPMTGWLQASLKQSNNLAATAIAAGVPIEESFAGKQFVTPHGTLTVLGPSQDYYKSLVPQILDKSAAKAQHQRDNLFEQFSRALTGGVQTIASILESHHIETLTDGGDTTPSNNSSTILLLELNDGDKYLFTGDAGVPALELAHIEYEALGHSAGQLKFVQVPHHGSRRNIGPTILDKFLGERTAHPDEKRGVAYVSVGKTCEKDGHPKKVATNAFKRRGYPVFQTRGNGVKYGQPLDGYGATATPLPLYDKVEPASE
jgi:beta-lactamase superfamily II metal-dependent hydrolase